MKFHKNTINKYTTLTVDNARNAYLIVNKNTPENGAKKFIYTENDVTEGWYKEYADVRVPENEYHNWVIVRKKTYYASDIDCICALEDGTLMIYFKDETSVETSSVDFLSDGKLDI